MYKLEHIREEDYWLFPIVFINIVCVAVAVYASVLMFRAPAIVLGFLGIWFTSSKVRKGYSAKRAQIHIGLTLFFGLLLAYVIYLLTN
ncbi:MAG: hypothetical protein JWO47_732 [Candidatus Saccharibacteria bacterium]|nr:hypothetical protein [Candidatus Saccharibacteria bacterium]